MSRNYRNYKDNSMGKGFWGGIIAFVLLVVLAVGAIAITNAVEDNNTQLEENEADTGSEVETETGETEVIE